MDQLMILSGISFIFTLWLLVLKIKGVTNAESVLITNLLLMALITMIAYTAFYMNKISKTFGFRKLGDDIKLNLSNKQVKKKPLKKK